MKSTTFVMNFVMLAIFVAMVGIASQYPPQARFMPFVVGIPAIILCLVQIALDIRAARRTTVEVVDSRSELEKAQQEVSRMTGRQVEFDVAKEQLPTVEAEAPPADMVRRECILWGYFLGFIGGILVIGFWPSIPVFLVSFLRLIAKVSWLKALLGGILGTIVLYFGVTKGLRIDLFPGFLTQYILDQMGV